MYINLDSVLRIIVMENSLVSALKTLHLLLTGDAILLALSYPEIIST